MRNRLRTLRRLSAVYRIVEEIHSTETRKAALAVAEAQIAIQVETTRTHEARQGGYDALLTDDCAGWSLAIVHEEIAQRRRTLLQPLLEQREERHQEACAQHMASRLRNEQIKSLVQDAFTHVAVETERQAQHFADDRFLSGRMRTQKTR